MGDRIVTEMDFRLPELRDAKPEDYEWRDDGKLVRKDRWETGVRRIAGLLGLSGAAWEIDEIVAIVGDLIDGADTKRLDWLESEENGLSSVETDCGRDMHFEVVSYHMQPPTVRVIGTGATPREAIDAAIAKATEAGHG